MFIKWTNVNEIAKLNWKKKPICKQKQWLNILHRVANLVIPMLSYNQNAFICEPHRLKPFSDLCSILHLYNV